MAHYVERDRMIIANLSGAAARHAGDGRHWRKPEGDDRERALAELREIATVGRRTLRSDLLAERAGVLLGAAEESAILRSYYKIQADLLIDAGAGPPELIEQWRGIGRSRARRPEVMSSSLRKPPPGGGWARHT